MFGWELHLAVEHDWLAHDGRDVYSIVERRPGSYKW